MSILKIAASLLFVSLAAWGAAFDWSMDSFPDGDQHYMLEFRSGAGEDAAVSTLEIGITDLGGTFEVVTTLSLQQDVPKDEFGILGMTGFGAGMNLIGPATMLGPAFVYLIMLEGQDIRVRSEPLIMVGLGEMHMERTEAVAGFECVVIRFVPANGEGDFEFGLAENLPFPCFSRYGSGFDAMEMRLVSAR